MKSIIKLVNTITTYNISIDHINDNMSRDNSS